MDELVKRMNGKKSSVRPSVYLVLPRRWTGLMSILIVAGFVGAAPGQTPPPAPPMKIQVMLVKNALTALNHANLTGNYTVLRDLGTTAFRQRNTPARLETAFQILRDRKTDLSPILMLEPQFLQPPVLNERGALVLVGLFPTRPLQVQFQVIFQQVGGAWMLDAISVGLSDPSPPPASAAPAPSPTAPPVNSNQAVRRPSEGSRLKP